MMLYTVVQEFNRASGEAWERYVQWRGLPFERFDSVDAILRPSLFEPASAADWAQVVDADFRLKYLTDLRYARDARERLGAGLLLGVSFDAHDESHAGFLGYDLIDGYCDVSLLTNWGRDIEIVNRSLASNALIASCGAVERIQRRLAAQYGDDPHVASCQIVSIYSV